MVKTTTAQKIEMYRILSKVFMLTVFVYPIFACLWKRVVEKLVENVEK